MRAKRNFPVKLLRYADCSPKVVPICAQELRNDIKTSGLALCMCRIVK